MDIRDEAAQLLKDITPGEWQKDTRSSRSVIVAGQRWRGIASTGGFCTNGPDEDKVIAENEANAAFIAAAPRLVRELLAAMTLAQGAMRAQDERERLAGDRCGVPYVESGCDWPDAVAEEVLRLRQQLSKCQLSRIQAEQERDDQRALKILFSDKADAFRARLRACGQERDEPKRGQWEEK